MATCSRILDWIIPWTEELGGLQFMGSQGVGHDWECANTIHTDKSEAFWADKSFNICSLVLVTATLKPAIQDIYWRSINWLTGPRCSSTFLVKVTIYSSFLAANMIIYRSLISLIGPSLIFCQALFDDIRSASSSHPRVWVSWADHQCSTLSSCALDKDASSTLPSRGTSGVF